MQNLVLLSITLVTSLAVAGTEPKPLNELSLDELYSQTAAISTETTTDEARNTPAEQAFLDAYFELLPILRQQNASLDELFVERHVTYILNELNPSEKEQAAQLFSNITRSMKNEGADFSSALLKAGPAALIAKIAKINRDIAQLKDMHKDVITYARIKHEVENEQMYGEHPYSYHLRKVRGVLKRFGFGPKDSLFGLRLGTAAWLHDVVEDTNATYEDIVELFDADTADIVLGVSKLDEAEGQSSEERIRLTYERTARNKGSRILKVADRIANVEEGLIDLYSGKPSIVHKYFKEWPVFFEMLYVPGEADAMWRHLERLLTDKEYSQNYALMLIQHKRVKADCETLFF